MFSSLNKERMKKIFGGKVYEKHYQIGLFGNDITHYGIIESKTSLCLHRPKLHRGNNVNFGFFSLTYQGDQISNTLLSSETVCTSIC